MLILLNEDLLNQILSLKQIRKTDKLFLNKEFRRIWNFMEFRELKMKSQQSKKEQVTMKAEAK